MIAREELHELIDKLPEREIPTVRGLLRYLAGDPLLRALAEAPIDDEEETEKERAAVAEGRAEIARGEVYSWEEVRAELEAMDAEEAEADRRAKRAS